MFYLKQVRPEFKLYVSPINFDPAHAAIPLSTPKSYAEELEEKFGPFFTKGLPADTSALDNDVLDEAEFLQQDDFVLEERRQMLDYHLDRFDSGLLFYYLSSTDQRQHMFWRLIDKEHPIHDPLLASKYGDTIKNIYIEADKMLGKAMEKAGKDTIIMVMSDHGFTPFRRGLNVNTWLKENGYLHLINQWRQGQDYFFENTDWSKTGLKPELMLMDSTASLSTREAENLKGSSRLALIKRLLFERLPADWKSIGIRQQENRLFCMPMWPRMSTEVPMWMRLRTSSSAIIEDTGFLGPQA
jgi:hypothetical protein